MQTDEKKVAITFDAAWTNQDTEELIKIREGKEKTSTYLEIPNIPTKTNIKPEISILVRTEDQLNIALRNNIQRIYTPSKELYEKYIKDSYNVLCVFDDRQKVVDMWREEGLLCCQVYYGDF